MHIARLESLLRRSVEHDIVSHLMDWKLVSEKHLPKQLMAGLTLDNESNNISAVFSLTFVIFFYFLLYPYHLDLRVKCLRMSSIGSILFQRVDVIRVLNL